MDAAEPANMCFPGVHELSDAETSVLEHCSHLARGDGRGSARTIETLTAAVGELLGAFTAEECANYFANSGYART